MNHREEIKNLFSEAKNEYNTLKINAENKIVRWFWATDEITNLAPFYFEENRYPKGKILKETPKDVTRKTLYGVDNQENIIIERRYTEMEDVFYETIYFRKENEILSYHFDYQKDREPINLKKYVYENGLLTHIFSQFKNNGFWLEKFVYENGKIIRKEWQGTDFYGEKFERIRHYDYDDLGMLQTIKEGDYVFYKKPDKKLSYKKLGELVQEKLLILLKQHIQNHAPKKLLYCLNFSYMAENIIPPQIGFGTENDRAEWLKDTDYDNIIWNTADYEHFTELDYDDETARLFDLFNQETELNEKHANAIKIIVECARQIKENLAEFDLEKTADFVVVASYFDQSDLKKNFKQINPELFEKFKRKL